MEGEMVTTQELLEYLGADEQDEQLVESLRAFALEQVGQADGGQGLTETVNEAVRVQVWLSYHGVRDAVGNTAFLREYLDGLLNRLRGEGDGA